MVVETRPFINFPGKMTGSHCTELTVDSVSLKHLEATATLPMFVTSLNAVSQRARSYVQTLSEHFERSKVYYAMKANSALPILREVHKAGCGLDIVSIGEFRVARSAGVPAEDICFAGVGKTKDEIAEALKAGLGVINVEHGQELVFVLETLRELKTSQAKAHGAGETLVALRLNPCVDSQTHPHLRTGALDSKFGLLLSQIEEWVAVLKQMFMRDVEFNEKEYLSFVAPLRGLHVHIGSQLQSHDVFPLVIQRVSEAVLLLKNAGILIDHLDLGGGLGVGKDGSPSDNQDIQSHIAFQADCLKTAVKKSDVLCGLWGAGCERVQVCIEPGRSVVASSTVFLTKVLYEKANMPSHRFAYVDAGMNAFPRPAIYGAEHQTACANKPNVDLIPYRVFGPVCESGDVLAREAMLPRLDEGDCVVFFEAGAYCRSMASHYNQRSIPAELFCRNGEVADYIPAIDPTAFLVPGALPSQFSEVVESRRSVRRFSSDCRVPEKVMTVALEHALLAPNSSNLQMWEFIWVRSAAKRKKLVEACLSQPAAATAAELVICVARMDTWQANRQRMLDAFSQKPAVPEQARRYYEKIIPLALNQGPFGLIGLAKRVFVTVGGLFRAVPRQPTSHSDMRVWAVKSTALACQNLMLSLRAQGFDTCPMEGFDSKRVKKIASIKGRQSEIVMVLGVGAALPEGVFGERLRFDSKYYIRHI